MSTLRMRRAAAPGVHRRGEAPAAVLRKRGAVQRATWTDPDDQHRTARDAWQVAGWRRVDPVLALFLAGRLRREQWQAAERFRDDVAAADGVAPDRTVDRVMLTQRVPEPPARQLDAIAAVRAATRGMTAEETDVLSAVVLNCQSLTWTDHRGRRREGWAKLRLSGVLWRLARHYGLLEPGVDKRAAVG